MKFRYVEPTIEFKDKAIDYINEFNNYNSNINGTGGLDRYITNYESWLLKLEKDYTCEATEDRVPGRTYFLVDETNEIIGMSNIRLVLNEKLKKTGGNIGYSIRPTKRGNGYNKINLYLALKVCYEYKIKKAMLSAAVDNPASWKTMEALGAELDEVFDDEGELEKRYYIDVDKSLEKYKDKYEKYLY